MTDNSAPRRYVYRTTGVCPPEIHFTIRGERLGNLRFVGGGCPGNARLVARLLQGHPVAEVIERVRDIECRNSTSCPDQLGRALAAAISGELPPALSFRIHRDSRTHKSIALIGDLDGNTDVFLKLMDHISSQPVDLVCSVGNLTGRHDRNAELIRAVRKHQVAAVQGARDHRFTDQYPSPDLPDLSPRHRDWLLQLPQVLSFDTPQGKGMAFYGEYLQSLPGYSDYEPFALEMNMVCGLTRFMQDESVFPALEAMLPQFEARIVIFGQPGKWGHWGVGDTDFISVGPAWDGKLLSWAHLEIDRDIIRFNLMNTGI